MPLVVDVPVGAVDLDLGSVEQAYQMVLPPKFKPLTQDDFYHITPLTTALWSSVEGAGGWWGSNLPGVMADQQKREQLMNSWNRRWIGWCITTTFLSRRSARTSSLQGMK